MFSCVCPPPPRFPFSEDKAGDLVDAAWHGHVEALATALRQARKRSEDQENGFTTWCFKVVTRRAPLIRMGF